MKVWDLDSGDLIHSFVAHEGSVNSISAIRAAAVRSARRDAKIDAPYEHPPAEFRVFITTGCVHCAPCAVYALCIVSTLHARMCMEMAHSCGGLVSHDAARAAGVTSLFGFGTRTRTSPYTQCLAIPSTPPARWRLIRFCLSRGAGIRSA